MAMLNHARFGQLHYRANEESWVGWIELPHFAECRVVDDNPTALVFESEDRSVEGLREKNRQARDQRELAAGRFQLAICDPKKNGPTDLQQRAFDLLLEREDAILESVLQWIVKVYRGGDYWTFEGLAHDSLGPRIDNPDELKRHLRLERVMINADDTKARAREDAIPITFYFSSPLDEEHGIEVSTIGTDVEDEFAEEQSPHVRAIQAFQFSLPPTIDARPIEPSTNGHRFVELRYDNRWSGVFVLDSSLQCVGTVANTFPNLLLDPGKIQAIRPVTRRLRWQSSWGPRVVARLLVGALNWLVALPCLVMAWVYEPRLYWLCLAIGIFAHAVYYFFQTSQRYLFGLATAQIVLSIAGLFFETRGLAIENEQRAAMAVDWFGGLLWWGTCLITLTLGTAVIGVILTSKNEVRREGWSSLAGVVPVLLGVVTLAVALTGTSSWGWSKLHFLWLTPAIFLGMLVLYIFAPVTTRPTPCPHCGKPLASRTARQCLHCGADWHGSTN